MKAIMYHYVRPGADGLPYFRYLHLDDFRCQLDWFQDRFRFPPREEVFAAAAAGRTTDGVVLTFDDGFSDHSDFVVPELLRRGLWGIFYIATGPHETGRLLDVHRIHYILGRLGGAAAMDRLRAIVTPDMLSHDHVAAFRSATYTRQDNDAATDTFKRTLNYYISYAHRPVVMDRLMAPLLGTESEAALARRFYAGPAQWRAMAAAGMEIGSHGHDHLVMSKLDPARQAAEITRSCAILEHQIGVPVRTYCHPYGGFHSFDADTEGLLDRRGIAFSFNVEQRDIEDRDVLLRPQALPRYDCNQFPYGRARFGDMPLPVEQEAARRA